MMSSPKIKNISLHNSGNQNYNCARLAPTRGAYHDRHDTWGAGCDGRFGVRRFLTPDENAKAYGEVVWSWRRDAGAKSAGSIPLMTVTTSPLHRGEHEVSRKAIAQGMSECFRCPVCSCAPTMCILAHETAGAARTRHSLRPRFSREAKNLHHSGEIAPRDRGRTFSPHVVPANAGTHTPRRILLWCAGRRLCFNNCRLGLWAPAFAGATVREDS